MLQMLREFQTLATVKSVSFPNPPARQGRIFQQAEKRFASGGGLAALGGARG